MRPIHVADDRWGNPGRKDAPAVVSKFATWDGTEQFCNAVDARGAVPDLSRPGAARLLVIVKPVASAAWILARAGAHGPRRTVGDRHLRRERPPGDRPGKDASGPISAKWDRSASAG